MLKASIVIPAYQAERTIGQCVESVLKDEYKDFEVIVVDDGSNDGTRRALEQIRDTRLKVLANETNLGAAASRNYGIKEADGELIIFLDSDSYVDSGWIGQHVEAHSEIEAEIIGGGIVGVHSTAVGKSDGFCNWFTSIPNSKSKYLKSLHLPANNMSVKRDVVKKIGLLDESIPSAGGEDSEYCYRALKNGIKIYFKSDLVAYHYDRDDLKTFLDHMEYWGKSAIPMRKKLNMDYSILLPSSYWTACLSFLPLAILYTLFVVCKWIRYAPSVLIYAPLILVGNLKQTIAMKNSLRR